MQTDKKIERSYTASNLHEKTKIAPDSSDGNFMRLRANAMLAGLIRGTVILFIEHPFDVIKTRMQAQSVSGDATIVQIIRELVNKFGYRGLMRGYSANLGRAISKSVIRFTVYPELSAYLQKRYPDDQTTRSLVKGVTMTGIESGLFVVPERIKVAIMTNHKKNVGIVSFIRENRGKLYQETTRGFSMLLLKKFVAWFAWDFASEGIRVEYLKITGQNKLSNSEELGCAVAASVSSLPVIMPFDYAKTQMQAAGSRLTIRSLGKQLHAQFLKSPSKIYSGFFVSLPIFILHDVIQAKLRNMFRDEIPVI